MSNAIVEVAAQTLCEMQGHTATTRDATLASSPVASPMSSHGQPAALDSDDDGCGIGRAEDGEALQQQTTMMIEWDESDSQSDSPLPEGWIVTWHESGLPIYMHEATAVCTLARPYVVCRPNWQSHAVPISSVPCFHYRDVKRKRTVSSSVSAAASCPTDLASDGSCIGGGRGDGSDTLLPPHEQDDERSEHHYCKGGGAFSVKQDSDSSLLPVGLPLKPIAAADCMAAAGSFADSRFLDIDDILRILAETPAQARVPACRALPTSCWYVVANEKNNERRARGRKSQFYDGRLWRSRGASTNKTYFLLDESGKTKCTLTLHDGQYCVARHSASRAKRQPLERQPRPEELLIVYRYYAREKDDPALQRRVTWVSDCPPTLDRCILNKALYEYKHAS